ncbi:MULTISPECIES: triose-phosphate isomerase [unclassified Mucilaginibacter]|uniref:triose-phosphate isomerase n=1 Tax=unclassified Mucilaginibacter TaxID=2617802 RepID=UPI000969B016|nr:MULTISPECIES: triose-phosphate isomerase [unclassified Mucilaginibacter]OJW15967.1 MAG: triose-phosphate isomerase [Mucilaginibacter sp. 44-25]PLW89177.1 MAG: triose-phosphate isomerase [Mucilaginibacter sp.]PMP64980.1 MAG: triose-phosphate isomerase [Mucilaginibacter sp.]HEK19913.1 triose-phosphate isomerase [Bacteroidota bacterium]
MRKKIVAGNWKMNLDYNEGLSLFSEVLNMVKDEATGTQEVVVCSPFIHLHSLVQLAKGNNRVSIGAQNAHQAESGAYTGEVSAKQIKSVGAAYVILGHSERRQYFGETNQLLAQKTDTALANGLKPIFCIGETLQEREAGEHFNIIKTQLQEGIYHLDADKFSQIVLAYEPVWAIGTGVTATSEQAQEIHAFIRQELASKYGQQVADDTTILYGGSCNAKNAPELFAQHDIDGGLIGGASLKSRDFTDIVKVFN